MYYQYFGLTGPPFSAAFSATNLYLGAGHREALAALEWGLCEPSGFTLLVGEAGTGKTTLILSLLERRLDGVRVAWVSDPRLSFPEMLQVIAAQLGLRPRGSSRFELLQTLENFVAGLKPGQPLTLIFDEVQALSDELLEELRLLRNLRSGSEKRLQMILVGHLDFVNRLVQPAFDQLNQRIGARALLPLLQPNEIRDYVEYRLRGHGGSVQRLFADRAINELVRNCEGIPRKINLLCDNALLGAYAQGARKVSRKHMSVAIRDYDDLLWTTRKRSWLSRLRIPSRARGRGWGFGGVVIACGLLFLSLGLSYHFGHSAAARLAALHLTGAATVTGSKPVKNDGAGLLESGAGMQALHDGLRKVSDVSATMSAAPEKGAADSRVEAAVQKEPVPSNPAVSAPVPVEPMPPQPPAITDSKPSADAASDAAQNGSNPEDDNTESDNVDGDKTHGDKTLGDKTPDDDTQVVVKKGDSLSKIASQFFGSGGPEQVKNLVEANPQISDADHIYPGQIIHARELTKGNQQ